MWDVADRLGLELPAGTNSSDSRRTGLWTGHVPSQLKRAGSLVWIVYSGLVRSTCDCPVTVTAQPAVGIADAGLGF